MMINLNWQPGMSLEVVEKHVILQAFRFYRGNKTMTSNALGIAIRTLDSKLEKYAADDVVIRKADDERRKDAEAFGLRQRGIRPAHPRGSIDGVTVQNQDRTNGFATDQGVRMESIANAPAQSSVPMQERKEVQGLPSKQIAKGDSRRTR